MTLGANALPQLIALCRADTAEEEERAFIALKAVVRCLRSAFAHQLYKLAILPAHHRVATLDVIAQDGEQRVAAEALVDWASSQYRKAVDAIVSLVAHTEAGLQVPAIQALFDVMQLEIAVRLNAKTEAELHASWIERVSNLRLCACRIIVFFCVPAVTTSGIQLSLLAVRGFCIFFLRNEPKSIRRGNHS